MFRICSKLTVNTPERRQLTTIGVTRKIPPVKLTPGEFPPETPQDYVLCNVRSFTTEIIIFSMISFSSISLFSLLEIN